MMFRSLLLSCSLLGFLANGALMAMEEDNSNSSIISRKINNSSPRELVPFNFEDTFPMDMQKLIVQWIVVEQCLENKSPVNLALVSKKWREIQKGMEVNNPGWKAWHGIVGPEKEAIYQQFFNGKLVYRPDPQSDVGMITLKIADFPNPLKGTFDLSNCGDTGEYLSIATGCRTVETPANAKKLEIWFTPRFLIEKELNTLPQNHHMREILKTWEVKYPVGMFWTGGGWNATSQLPYCDYLITESMADLGSEGLLKKYKKRETSAGACGGGGCTPAWAARFHISFLN